MDRIFVEWYDPERPEWGGYVSSLDPDFQKALVEGVQAFGPPTKVEFRAHDEGWIKGRPEDAYCDACQSGEPHECSGDPECDCCVKHDYPSPFWAAVDS